MGVLEQASRLHSRHKVDFFKTKILLKDIALSRLPRETVLRKKRGFGIPIAEWLRGPLKGFAQSILSKEKIESASLLSFNEVHRLLEQHFTGTRDNSARIWTLLVFQVWYEKWVKGRQNRL